MLAKYMNLPLLICPPGNKYLSYLIPIESSCRNSDGESDEDGVGGTHFSPPPGSVIYTVPPDGTHLPPGMVIYAPPVPGLAVGPGSVFYGPPPEGVGLVYGPPPSGLHIPLIPNGTLHCNVPGHLNMVRHNPCKGLIDVSGG